MRRVKQFINPCALIVIQQDDVSAAVRVIPPSFVPGVLCPAKLSSNGAVERIAAQCVEDCYALHVTSQVTPQSGHFAK
jgi:hypothetical protein